MIFQNNRSTSVQISMELGKRYTKDKCITSILSQQANTVLKLLINWCSYQNEYALRLIQYFADMCRKISTDLGIVTTAYSNSKQDFWH